MTMAKFTTLFSWDTVQSADSSEWCPLAPCQNIFVCGTYQIKKEIEGGLDEAQSSEIGRIGRVYVFEVLDSHHIEPHQVIDLPAVLDMKWSQSYVCGKILLAVATSSAMLLLFELKEDKKLVQLTQVQVEGNDNSKEVLALSLDWSCGRAPHNDMELSQVSIIVSDSHGGVSLFQLSQELHLSLLQRLQGHGYEAWIAAFNYWKPSVLFSGGDDCVLNGWDLRVGLETPIFVNRSHDAGVTSLQNNAKFEQILASGSYDEQLRIWDLRKMKHPVHTCNMSGGVWRIKWNPHSFESILSACMHGGFKVVECKGALKSSTEPEILATYKNHASIAYGADWCHLGSDSIKLLCSNNDNNIRDEKDDEDLSLISTCSFYDHKLCISLFSKPQSL